MPEILIPGARIDRTAFRGSGPHGGGRLRVITIHCTTGPPGSIDGAISTLHSRHAESNSVIEHRASEGREHVQLVDGNRASKALKNEPGGTETNKAGVNYQVEVVGPAEDPVVGTTPDDWRWLGAELAKIGALLAIPNRAPFRFYPYLPTRWDPPQYLGREFWRTLDDGDDVQGWVAHAHWDENEHGDPGDLSSPDPRLGGRSPLSLMLDGAGGVAPSPNDPEEFTMDDEAKAAFANVNTQLADLRKGQLIHIDENRKQYGSLRGWIAATAEAVGKLLNPVKSFASMRKRAGELDTHVHPPGDE